MTNKTNNFIKKANKVHGDKYDYSKVEYVNSHTKVKIICKKHGEFEQIPSNHLSGRGCPKCTRNYTLTTDEFIEKAREVHGDKYDYSLVEYVNSHTKVKIICSTHGVFEQTPTSHVSGSGCKKCGVVKSARGKTMKLDEFIKRAKEVHGDKYDYSLVEYINSQTKVKIICPIHSEFEQIPSSHLSGSGCSKCSVDFREPITPKKIEQFLIDAKEVHGDKYDYSLVEYVHSDMKIKIICPKHGKFNQKPRVHLNNSGCPKCGVKNRLTNDIFIKRAKGVHGDKYDYSLVEYVDTTTKVKIICPIHDVFEQTPANHLKKQNCPDCAGYKKLTNKEFIKRAKNFHGDKYDYSKTEYKSMDKKVIIICPEHGEFVQNAASHLKYGCPICSGNFVDTKIFIEKAKEVHGDKYDYSLVEYVNSHTKVKIICPIHSEFEQIPSIHLSGSGCKDCGIEISTNSRRSTIGEFIEKAKAVHGDKYDYSKVEFKLTNDVLTIICPEHGDFQQVAAKHSNGYGCSKCAGNYRYNTEEFIERARTVHGDKYDYSLVEYINSHTKVKIICPIHSEFEQIPSSHLSGSGCKSCSIDSRSEKRRLTHNEYLERFNQVHSIDDLKISGTYVNMTTDLEFECQVHGGFKKSPGKVLEGQGCPMCSHGWSKAHSLRILETLSKEIIYLYKSFELNILIKQGLLPNEFNEFRYTDAGSEERLATFRELRERFNTADEDDIVDDIAETNANRNSTIDEVDEEITENDANNNILHIPAFDVDGELHSFDNYPSMDIEAFAALIMFKVEMIWQEIINNPEKEKETISLLRNDPRHSKYSKHIADLLLNEYDVIKGYVPPTGFMSRSKKKFELHLMQKLFISRLVQKRQYANWSGAGSGKTIAYIVASREIDSRLTVVIAINSTINQTRGEILMAYPDSQVFIDYTPDMVFDRSKHNYLILNYEKFQQPGHSEEIFQSLTINNRVDFVVIDEVHSMKQRYQDTESNRHTIINNMLGRIREDNSDVYVTIMSATPVINNLFEAVSLLRILTGLAYDDLRTQTTVSNGLSIHEQMLLNGVRFMPKYDFGITVFTGNELSNLDIDGSSVAHMFEGITAGQYATTDLITLRLKLNALDQYIEKGTVIYSYYKTGLISIIRAFVESKGLTCVTYTGDESTDQRDENLLAFQHGEADIIIGSAPIGTGVDGLQEVSDRMIILSLPWTDAEFEQLYRRLYRQRGDERNTNVEIYIPRVTIPADETTLPFSWDAYRYNLIINKRTISDTAMSGIVPSRVIPSRKKMHEEALKSLEAIKDRIDSGNTFEFQRRKIRLNLYPNIDIDELRRIRVNSELSEFNRRGKTLRSDTMHKEFATNPALFFRYHNLRKSRMEEWNEIPYEIIASKIKDKRDVIIDFGCGENKFKDCVPNNKVISFDHIAIDDTVNACDMKDVSKYVKNETVDVTVFSLALWGTNHTDYIKEAYRVLRRKGMIYIAEPVKNYDTSEKQQDLLNKIITFGFQKVGEVEIRNKFIYITGIKM